jgi:hypothetical protein
LLVVFGGVTPRGRGEEVELLGVPDPGSAKETWLLVPYRPDGAVTGELFFFLAPSSDIATVEKGQINTFELRRRTK